MKSLSIYLFLSLLILASCKANQPREVKLSLAIDSKQVWELENLIQKNQILARYNFRIEPNLQLAPEFLLTGNDQPDVFEVNYNHLFNSFPLTLGMKKLITDDYQSALFSLNYFQPGKFNQDYYYVPFRLSWLALFYRPEQLSAELKDLNEIRSLCLPDSLTLGLALADDEQLLQLMISFIWAFEGDEFDLENPQTKKALYLIAQLRDCLSPFSWNYDKAGLAQALVQGDIDFAFADFQVAQKLWEEGIYPYPIVGQEFPTTK